MRSSELLSLEVIWRVHTGVFGQDWGALWLTPEPGWQCGSAKLAGRQEQCVPGCGCQGQRVAATTLSQKAGEHLVPVQTSERRTAWRRSFLYALLQIMAVLHFLISISLFEITFVFFLICLSLPFPYLVALTSFWFCILPSISRFLLLPSVFPYSSSSLVFVLFPKLFVLCTLVCASSLKAGYGAPCMQDIATTALGNLLLPLLSSEFSSYWQVRQRRDCKIYNSSYLFKLSSDYKRQGKKK